MHKNLNISVNLKLNSKRLLVINQELRWVLLAKPLKKIIIISSVHLNYLTILFLYFYICSL
jgi:hypothetical protein